ncbi:FecR family protein [Chitinophaga skermanii]|uniref:FecR family protein n=1 Tax=Chitinophaga skermanii TaxID=331697 RepID=A0A327QYF8_9BACT|nr:FecR domain-containing protein [Chitinophaga skermanii]RAJ08798.1 FecR family protein [Chitinophaga skermanii]
MERNYQLYTKDDFLEDANFLAWVRDAKPADNAFWEQWQQQSPPNLAAMQQARELLLCIYQLERIPVPSAVKSATWDNIQQALQQQLVYNDMPRINSRKRWWYAAAVIAPLLAVGTWFLLKPAKEQRFATEYGKQLLVTLPDSTTVLLNSYSELTYGEWNSDNREVYLKGEALFCVKPGYNYAAAPFTVHAGNLRVEVLGTIFNVKNRRNLTEVFLESGKVRVTGKDKQPVILAPNEMARYNTENLVLVKVPTDKNVALAWRDQKMQLKQTTVKNIIETLHDMYGFTVVLQDSSIADRTIDGTLSLKNVNNVLFELSTILNVTIRRNNDTLVFMNNGQVGY